MHIDIDRIIPALIEAVKNMENFTLADFIRLIILLWLIKWFLTGVIASAKTSRNFSDIKITVIGKRNNTKRRGKKAK